MRLRFISLCMIFALTLTAEALAIVPRGEGSEIPKHPLMKALGETPEFRARIEALKGRYSINVLAASYPSKDQKRASPYADLSCYIAPALSGEEFRESVVYKARHWSEKNPEAPIHIWYDSRSVSKDAVEESREVIEFLPGTRRIQLRDICDIPVVSQNLTVFSDPLPIQFREELLRAVILHHLISSGEDRVSIYAEPGIYPLARHELFDSKTENHLKVTGLVMNYGRIANDFQMLSADHPKLLESMEFALIQLNLERAKLALKQEYFLNPSGKRDAYHPMAPLRYVVGESYEGMYSLFCAEEQGVNLEVYTGDQWEKYDVKRHWLYPFGLHRQIDVTFFMRLGGEGDFSSIPTKFIEGRSNERERHYRPYYDDKL